MAIARPRHRTAQTPTGGRLLAVADTFYERATAGIAALPGACRPGIHAARLIYAEIGREVERAGLDSVTVILRQAARHLNPRGLLVVEVGNTEHAVRRVFRTLPFVWLEFARGGGGVFLLTREQLKAH